MSFLCPINNLSLSSLLPLCIHLTCFHSPYLPFLFPLRMGRDAEHHHDAGAGGAAGPGEVHQLQRTGAGLHAGRGRGAQQRALHPDPGRSWVFTLHSPLCFRHQHAIYLKLSAFINNESSSLLVLILRPDRVWCRLKSFLIYNFIPNVLPVPWTSCWPSMWPQVPSQFYN